MVQYIIGCILFICYCFFLAAGWVYKKKPILNDIRRRIETIVVPYFSFGLLLLIYWQLIERRFRDSVMSFVDSFKGLLSGCYENLDFNVHLWFLPCFFMTVILFNVLVNVGGKKLAFIVSVLMSLIYMVLPMSELFWGVNRVFKYIGFYAIGVLLASKDVGVVRRKFGVTIITLILLAFNFFLSLYNLTTEIMWFVTGMIGVSALVLISQLIYQNRVLQYFGRISLIILYIHGPVYRIVVKVVSIPLQMSTDVVRRNFFLAMVVVAITMIICSVAYEIVMRFAPWMLGKSNSKKRVIS